MSVPLIESRVTSLESMMADLIEVSYRTQRNVDQLADEMKEFKDEMKDFKEEIRGFKDEMKDFNDEWRLRSAEADARLEKHIAESKLEMRQMNQKWGEIANKQGRMTEDLVAPSVCRILREVKQIPEVFACGLSIRIVRVHPVETWRTREFDAIAQCGSYVLVNETKSKLKATDVDELIEIIGEAREFFPEYADKAIIGSLASLNASPGVIQYASRKGILILAVGDELMDVQNGPGFTPAEF